MALADEDLALEDGVFDEAQAVKEAVAWQLAQEMKENLEEPHGDAA